MRKRKLSRKTGILLMLVLLLTFITPSSAGTGIVDIEANVIEPDILQCQESDGNRIHLSGSEAANGGQTFSVTMDVYASLTVSRISLPDVSDVEVLPGDTAISLSWIDPPGGGFDQILVEVNGEYSYIAAKGQQSIIIPDLINGEVYQFVLKTMDSEGNTSQGIYVTAIPGILGDVNYDGVINAVDLAAAAYNYLTQAGDPEWEQARRCDVAGNNGKPDGIVDIPDIMFIAKKILERQ